MSGIRYKGAFISFDWETAAYRQTLFDYHGFMRDMTSSLTRELQREGEIVKRAFERTISTWVADRHWAWGTGQEDLPEFEIETRVLGDEFSVFVTTDSEVYRFINNGTSVRFATMEKGYKSKSQPRVISSRSGGGAPLYVNKKVPRRGIEARNYVDEIADRREKYFYNNMERIIEKVFQRYWVKATGSRY
jgi:hypothetical protein